MEVDLPAASPHLLFAFAIRMQCADTQELIVYLYRQSLVLVLQKMLIVVAAIIDISNYKISI
jgi:hypothetical protein